MNRGILRLLFVVSFKCLSFTSKAAFKVLLNIEWETRLFVCKEVNSVGLPGLQIRGKFDDNSGITSSFSI